MPAPTKLNGYPVIASQATPKAPLTRAGYMVIVQKGPAEYVVAWNGEGDRDWWKGDYISDHAKAEARFKERLRQW